MAATAISSPTARTTADRRVLLAGGRPTPLSA
jgi:hypothetical protein